MLELQNIHKCYGKTEVLRGVSITVERGATVALIGPSGCGKSTAIRIAVGLANADNGNVIFDGESMGRKRDQWQSLRRRVGYVIQEGGLFPHMTARGNVTVMARELRWSHAKITDRLDELAALTHFPADALDRYPSELSGGQRQRVALMRALMLDPDVLLLDEPLGALDPMIRYELQDELKSIFAALGKAVLMVTHDLAEAAFFSDRIVLMREGMIEQSGSFEHLRDKPTTDFVSRFVTAQRGHERNGSGES
ncbi:MAG: ATP-binding cassette domain-containing protein [Planctomycetota bacterium]